MLELSADSIRNDTLGCTHKVRRERMEQSDAELGESMSAGERKIIFAATQLMNIYWHIQPPDIGLSLRLNGTTVCEVASRPVLPRFSQRRVWINIYGAGWKRKVKVDVVCLITSISWKPTGMLVSETAANCGVRCADLMASPDSERTIHRSPECSNDSKTMLNMASAPWTQLNPYWGILTTILLMEGSLLDLWRNMSLE